MRFNDSKLSLILIMLIIRMYAYPRSHVVKVSKLMMSGQITINPTLWTVPNKVTESLYVVKNSKFYAKVMYAETIEEVQSFINQHKDVKASHNCWAYSGLDFERVNDDGEPSGTAGRPILSAIQEYNLKNTVVLVVRYFGGIKLGTGGLSRAYQASAMQALSETMKIPMYDDTKIVKISCNSNDIGSLHQLIQYFNNKVVITPTMYEIDKNVKHESKKGYDRKSDTDTPVLIERLDEDYDLDKDDVIITLKIQACIQEEMKTMLVDLTKGKGSMTVL